MTSSRLLAALRGVGFGGGAPAGRPPPPHDALLYPDGYQYLLMARGIGEHLQPTTVLGPGGDAFTPSPDAAAKPLFPLVVAGVHTLGVSWLEAARLVTAVAGACAVTALALLVSRLSGSRTAGVAAALLVLASPSLGLWSGFSGPDPLAQALVLTAALAFVDGRSRLGGLLTGLAIATRPEIAVLAIAAGILALRGGSTRRQLRRAAPTALVTATIVFAIIQTPLSLPDWRFLALVPLFAAVAAIAALVPTRCLEYAALVAFALVPIMVSTREGAAEVWHTDWPLLVLAAVGFVVLLLDRRRRGTAIVALGAVVVLGAVYVLKNPTLARYFTLLLPAAAVLAGVAVASMPRATRPVALGAVAAATAVGFLHPVSGSRDYDMFPVVARGVARHLGGTALVTAAPDAYGFWLPAHAVREMRPGARGAVLLDATQRLYDPDLTATGSVVAHIDELAFAGPDLEIDADPAVLVAGEVVVADSRGRPVSSESSVHDSSALTRPEPAGRVARRVASRAAAGRSRP
jgi:hypothetical protein